MKCNIDNNSYELSKRNAVEYLNGLSDNELQFIAHLDYGMGAERHFESLKSVIARDATILVESENWFPYEVVELGANHLVPGHEREYTGCILIVIINVIHGNDSTKYLDDYIYDRSDVISSLPSTYKYLIEDLYFNQKWASVISRQKKDR